MALEEKGLLAPTEASTLAAVARSTARHRRVGGVPARCRCLVYDTGRCSRATCPLRCSTWPTRSGRASSALAPGETDFQPIVTSIIAAKGKAAAPAWLKAVKANASSHTYPDNETLVSQVDAGKVEIGIINHYYWFRLADERGASSMHSALSRTSPPRSRLRPRRVRGRRAGVEPAPGRGAEAPGLPGQPAGQDIIAHSNSFEYPIGSGVAANPALKPLRPAPADRPQHQPSWATGPTAVEMLQQVQLL